VKARKLIAHRHGVPGYELTSPPTCPSRRNRRAAHPGGPAGLGQGENRGGSNSVVCLNREVTGTGLPQLSERKFILSVVGERSRDTGDYSTTYFVPGRPLSSPGSWTCRCTVRTVRQPWPELGSCHGRLAFAPASVRRPGARALSLRGDVTRETINLIEGLESTVRETPKRVERREVTPPTYKPLEPRRRAHCP